MPAICDDQEIKRWALRVLREFGNQIVILPLILPQPRQNEIYNARSNMFGELR